MQEHLARREVGVTLFDREHERAAIERCLQERGRRVVLITGVPGIGKSSLLRETVDARPEFVLAATGSPAGAAVPFGTVRALFAPLARSRAVGEMPFDGPGAVLHSIATDTTTPSDLGAIVYGLQWALASLADDRGVVLALDDAQWLDDASGDVLGAALAQAADERIIVIVAIRDSADHNRATAEAQLRSLADVIVTPRPLSRGAVAALLGPMASEAGRVHELTGGVPFSVTEIATAIAAGERLAPSPRLLESITARLARLGHDATAVAQAVAVLGPEASVRRAAALAEAPILTLDPVLRSLVAEGILLDGDRDGVLALAHPLIGEAIIAGIGPVALQTARDRAARVLLDEGIAAARVAGLLMLGEPAGAPWRVDVLVAAADDAIASGAAGTAVALLTRAQRESPTAEQRLDLRSRTGRALLAAGRPADAASVLAAGEDEPVAADRVRRLMDLGDARYAAAEFPAAAEAYRAALAGCDQSDLADDDLALGAVTRLALGMLTIDPSSEPIPESLLADVVARDPADDGPAQRRLLAAAAVSAHSRQRWDLHPTALADRAAAGGAWAVDGFADDPTTYLLTGALYLGERFDAAIDLLDRAVEDAGRRGRASSELSARFTRGAIRIIGGDLREGLDDLEAAVGLGRLSAAPNHLYAASAGALLVRYSQLVGDSDRAAAVLAHLDEARLVGPHLAIVRLATADHHLHLGAPQLALRDVAGEGSRDDGILAWTFSWRSIAAAASLEIGDHDRAIELNAAELVALEQQQVPVAARIDAVLLSARLAPDAATARSRLDAAVAALATRHRWQRALLHERLAELDVLDGDIDLAGDRLLEVMRVAIDQGIAPLEDRARHALRRIGREPIARSMQVRLRSLTPSESRVASRAFAGKTNRAIAQELFVTVKTVEFHLGRVYRKLGIGSRAELVDRLGELDRFSDSA